MTEKFVWAFLFWFYLTCAVLLAGILFTQPSSLFVKAIESVPVIIVAALAINAKTGWFFWS